MDCLDPAMTETPVGTWACPQCSSIPPHSDSMLVDPMYPQGDTPVNHMEDPAGSVGRGTSVASTSQSALADIVPQTEIISKPRRPAGRPPGKRGPGRPPRPKLAPTPSVADDDAMDVEVEEEHMLAPSRSARTRTVKRPRTTREVFPDDDDGELGPPASSPLRSRRGRKPQNQFKEPSPGQSLPRVRLRLPSQSKGKGKEREEEESNSYGMFDDILSETDRDTSRTQITRVDKALFENSRVVAEVCRINDLDHILGYLTHYRRNFDHNLYHHPQPQAAPPQPPPPTFSTLPPPVPRAPCAAPPPCTTSPQTYQAHPSSTASPPRPFLPPQAVLPRASCAPWTPSSCAYTPSGLANTTSRPGTTPHSPKSMRRFRTVGCGYASSASSI